MFEKHKQKKLEKLRRMEANASFVQGEKENASENEEQAYYEKQVRRKKSMRRAMLRALAPGFAITAMLGLGIYYTTLPLGQFMAFGITLILLIVSNIVIYVYTNKIYIPPGIDFAVYGPVDPDDTSSQQEIGMWRVPTALTGNIRKDIPVSLKFIRVIPADSSMKADEKHYTPLTYTMNEINKIKVVAVGDTMAYKVTNFAWDDDTGDIWVRPVISYGHDDYDVKEGVMDVIQRDDYHLNRAYTLLKTKLPMLVEQRIRKIIPDTMSRMLGEEYDMPGKEDDKHMVDINAEIRKEEEQISPKVRGEE